ncbi:hypothetical protein CMK22_18905 [Candidatus Poribacteria bacterium]|nr:hypothetical protein [Candidatus Poribacteria bacterium]
MNNKSDISIKTSECLKYLIISSIMVFFIEFQVEASGSLEDKIKQAFTAYSQAQQATKREARMENFQRAQYLFALVSKQGIEAAALYTNIGTAALQAENLGDAVLAFRRALEIDPDYPQALQNLKQARELLPAWVPKPIEDSTLDSFFSWQRSLSTAEQSGLAALLFLLCSIGFAISIRWELILARNLAFLPLLLWMVFVVSYIIDITTNEGRDAVIIVDDTIARVSDSANAPQRFSQPMSAGMEVKVLEVRNDSNWAHVSLFNGRDAWVNFASLAYVDAPN